MVQTIVKTNVGGEHGIDRVCGAMKLMFQQYMGCDIIPVRLP
jgi:hypothetical protein